MSVRINFNQARELLEFFGGEDADMTVGLCGPEAHSGAGLYVWCTEHPEEGSMKLDGEPGDWALELGAMQPGDVELLEDAIEALLQPRNELQREHALHGLQRRVEAAKALADGSAGDLRKDRRTVPQLLAAAAKDTDAASIFYNGTGPADYDSAVVVIKGRENVDYVAAMLTRQQLTTPGKPVEGSAIDGVSVVDGETFRGDTL